MGPGDWFAGLLAPAPLGPPMSATLRGVRNAFRRPGRTAAVVALVGLSIGLALSMAAARSAVDAQVAEVQATAGTLLSIEPAREGQFFMAAGSAGGAVGPTLNETDLAVLASDPDIASYSLDLQAMLAQNRTSLKSAFQPPPGVRPAGGGNAIRIEPPMMAFGTTRPDRVPLPGGGAFVVAIGPDGRAEASRPEQEEGFRITSGSAFDGASRERVALVGARVADANNLTVGSAFTVLGPAGNETITVSGVFDAGNPFANGAVLMPLDTVQELLGLDGKVSRSEVRVGSLEDVAAVQARLQAALGDGAEVIPADPAATAALAPLEDIGALAWSSLVGAALAAGAVTVLTMVLVVRERRREVGVLKAIGAAPRHILRQFAAESATLALLGVAIGLGFAAVANDAVLDALANNSGAAGAADGVRASLGPAAVAAAAAAGLLLAAAGAVVPALLVTRIRPADVLRGA
jgi:putative ABC transport system permease protein